jgi:hypothetical protein
MKNPKEQPCKTCEHFRKDGWCNSLATPVLGWWTGCIRWIAIRRVCPGNSNKDNG